MQHLTKSLRARQKNSTKQLDLEVGKIEMPIFIEVEERSNDPLVKNNEWILCLKALSDRTNNSGIRDLVISVIFLLSL